MNLKLKSYVYFVERPDGVLLRGADRNLVVRGEGAYSKVACLIEHCDGRFTRDQLRGAVPAAMRGWFDQLVDELEANRFLVPHETPLPDEAPEDAFADVLAYLNDWHATPRAAFDRWRRTPLIAIGSGRLAAAAAHALASFGFAGFAAQASLALVMSDDILDMDLARAVSDTGLSETGLVLVAGTLNGQAVVLPPVSPAAAAEILDRLRVSGGGTPSETMLIVTGGLVALAALNHVCGGLPPSVAPHASVSLVGAQGFVSAHPIPDVYWRDVPAPASTSWAAGDDALHDPLVGLFQIDHGAADSQLPLHLFGLRARNPRSAGGDDTLVLGWGLTEEEAAYRAHALAVAAHARVTVACRSDERIAMAESASATEEADLPLPPVAQIAPRAQRSAMFARMLHIFGIEAHGALRPLNDVGWWHATVVVAGETYRCVGETPDAALGEILGTLVAHLQAGWDGRDRLAAIPPLAARMPEAADAFKSPVSGNHPILTRLGWHLGQPA